MEWSQLRKKLDTPVKIRSAPFVASDRSVRVAMPVFVPFGSRGQERPVRSFLLLVVRPGAPSSVLCS